ncbi:MAG: methionine synthase [Oscillospiraceae bacterium]|nr:methionine synthase [Oscillospiraceae bacterium]
MEEYNIQVDIHEACRYMGCPIDADTSVQTAVKNAAALIEKTSVPRVITKICDIDKTNGIYLKGTGLQLSGKAIASLLHNCEQCAIFCATIGSEFEALIRKWQLKDLAFATMLDACASSAVESLCDSVEAALARDFGAQGYYLTDRFSPGYGDLPLSIQPDFCAALDTTRKIGVSISESGIMIPRKTVTAVIGFSKYPQKHIQTGCSGCSLSADCKFRENGVTCYGQAI